MKKLNILNKSLIILAVILLAIFVVKVVNYKSWDRYYYTSSVSTPELFPIHLVGIGFLSDDVYYFGDFYKDIEKINWFYSGWGEGETYEAHSKEFLPKKLYVEYVDFRTKRYYLDTIALPLEIMESIFREAKSGHHLQKLSYIKSNFGLAFHVGIANEGNLVFWLVGNDYVKEFYHTQIMPKPFPQKFASMSRTQDITDSTKFIHDLFNDIPDSVQVSILNQDVTGVQFRDSIPQGFSYLRGN